MKEVLIMKNWNKKTWKEKILFLLPFAGALFLLGVLIYCMITPDFFWVVKNGEGLLFYKRRVIMFLFTFLLGMYACFGNFSKEKKGNQKRSMLIFLLTPIVMFLAMEYANPAGPSLIWNRIYYVSVLRSIVTILLLYLVLITLFFLTNSVRFAGCFLWLFALVFCLGNYFTTKFRGIPILASDLTIMGTALNVAGNYDYVLDFERTLLVLCSVIWGVLLFRIEKLRITPLKKRVAAAIFTLVLTAGTFQVLIYTPVLRRTMHVTINTFRPIKSYKKNGAILTFLRSVQLMLVEKPNGYSKNTADAIADAYRGEAEADEDTVTPNVIAVMDEAFADLQAVGDFETSEDVMPFYRSLKENTVKGFVYVSIFGGQTANSEFEFLTGLSKAYIPESSTPYQLYIKSLLPGLTTFLGDQGYQGMKAFHPFHANGYNRHNVYPNLGFSDFISLEDLKIEQQDLLRGFVSDKKDFQIIIDEYEKAKEKSDAPFYLFNVTMQNHSGYDKDFDNFDQPITIEKDFDDPEVKRYLNLVRHSDEALKTLINYFEKVDEPTVIVFFGDHEPGLSDDFFSALYGKNVESLSAEENMEMYKTPFLIWANYDIEEKEGVNTSANYLSSLMLESTGMPLSPFNRFLLELSKDVPVLTSHGYFGSDGNFYELNDKQSPYYEELENYHILQYNHLFDKKNRIDNFFW